MVRIDDLQTAWTGLRRWLIAQTYDSLAVGMLWLVGLWLIGVPWAPFWAVLGVFLQFIPHFGPVLTLIGPAIAAAVDGWLRLVYVLILYAVIAVLDGLFLQPYFMKRTAKVPIWASIMTPIVLGLFFSFWGVLFAAPLLALIYAFRSRADTGPEP